MDVNLTPDLTSTLSTLGQFFPLQGTTDQQQGGGLGLAQGAGGENAQDYTGQLSDIRGLLDKGNTQITSLQQANSVLGGQINSFSGTLTGVQNQVGGINSQVGALKSQMDAGAQRDQQMQTALSNATQQITGLGSQVTGVQTGIGTLQTNDTAQTAYMNRLGAAIEKIKSGIKV